LPRAIRQCATRHAGQQNVAWDRLVVAINCSQFRQCRWSPASSRTTRNVVPVDVARRPRPSAGRRRPATRPG
jgi:hypothetical protein